MMRIQTQALFNLPFELIKPGGSPHPGALERLRCRSQTFVIPVNPGAVLAALMETAAPSAPGAFQLVAECPLLLFDA